LLMLRTMNSLLMPLTGAIAVYLIPRRQVEEGNVIDATVIVLHDEPLPLQVLTTYRFPSLSTWQKSVPVYDGSTLNKVGS
jgi:hypothetical protein